MGRPAGQPRPTAARRSPTRVSISRRSAPRTRPWAAAPNACGAPSATWARLLATAARVGGGPAGPAGVGLQPHRPTQASSDQPALGIRTFAVPDSDGYWRRHRCCSHEHRKAKVSKPEPNHPNRPNQFLGQNPNFRNSLRGFDRHKECHLKGYARTGICKILPFYRNMGPNMWCSKGLDRPEIGLHAKGLDEISGVLFVI